MPDAGSRAESDLGLRGLSHLVIQVSDAGRAAAFYAEVLGLERSTLPWPEAEGAAVLAADGGQHVILVPSEAQPDLRETGVHHAFVLAPGARDKVARRLGAHGADIFTYSEDPPEESKDGFYFFDPDGNRIQLIARADTDAGGAPVLHHTAIQVADILWAEQFYAEVLGLTPVHRVGWATADYARAQAWADGKEDMAPGTRRMDKRYSSIVNNRLVPRVNMQVYFACGAGRLAVYLANQHFQESPEEATTGVPRTGLRVSPAGLARAAERLNTAGWRFEGPVSHDPGLPIAASIYLRDPGGNFIELATAGDAAR
ncbi:MAG: VOC family protein [Alphaproteobacteria bacterium]|nr:VOC family protein [Alphaproteobacteria bacterium]